MNSITEHTGSLLRFCAMLLLLLGFTSGAALAQTFWAAPDGTGIACTAADPCSLGEAVDQARQALDADNNLATSTAETVVIRIADGTYEEDEDFDSIILAGDHPDDEVDFQGWAGDAADTDDEVNVRLTGNSYSFTVGNISVVGTTNNNIALTLTLTEVDMDLRGGVTLRFADNSIVQDADADPTNGGNFEIRGSGNVTMRVAEPDPATGDNIPSVTIENLIINRTGTVNFEELERFAAVLDPVVNVFGRLLVQNGQFTSSDGTLDLDFSADGNGTVFANVPTQLEIATGATIDFDDVVLDITDAGSNEFFVTMGGGTLISSGLDVTTAARSTWLSFVEVDGGDFNVTSTSTSAGVDGEVIFTRLQRVGEGFNITGAGADTDFVFERDVVVEGDAVIDDATIFLTARTLADGASVSTKFEGDLTFNGDHGLDLGHDPNGANADSHHNIELQGDLTVNDSPLTPTFPAGLANVFRLAGQDDIELLLEEDFTVLHLVVDLGDVGDEAEILEESDENLIIPLGGFLEVREGELTTNGLLQMAGATLEIAEGGEVDRNAGELAYTSAAQAPSNLIYSGSTDFVRRTGDEIEQIAEIIQLTIESITLRLDQDLTLTDELELDDGGVLNLTQFNSELTLDIDGPDDDGTGEENVADEFTITVDRGSIVGSGNLVYPSQTISDFEPGLDGILLNYTTESGTHLAGAEFPSNGFSTEVKTLTKTNAGTTQLRSGETFQINSDLLADGGTLDLNGAVLVVNQPINNTNVTVTIDQDGNLINSDEDAGQLTLQGEDVITVAVESNEGDDAHGAFNLPGILVDMSADGGRTNDEQQVVFMDLNDDPLADHGLTILNPAFFTIADAGTSQTVGAEGVHIANTIDQFNVGGLFLQEDGSFAYQAPAPAVLPNVVDLSSENVNALSAGTFTQTGGWSSINGTPFDVAGTFTTQNDGTTFLAGGAAMSAMNFFATADEDGGPLFNLGGGSFDIVNDVTVSADSRVIVGGGGAIMLGGDWMFNGMGDVITGPANGQGLRGVVVLDGTGEQTILHAMQPESQLGSLTLSNTVPLGGEGIVLGSDIVLNTAGVLTLNQGILNTDVFDVTMFNPATDVIPSGQIQTAAGSAVVGGSRISLIDDQMNRSILGGGGAIGGLVLSGTYYPLGDVFTNEVGSEQSVYRPLLLQFPNLGIATNSVVTLLDPNEASVTLPPNLLVEDREPNSNVVTRSLALNTTGTVWYRIEFPDELPAADFNVRIFADRQGGIRDITKMRIIQAPCPDNPVPGLSQARLAGVYDLFADPTDPGSVGLNDFISGVPSLIQEGVDPFACQILGIASDVAINPLVGDVVADGNTVSGTVVHGDSDTGVADATVTLSQDGTTVASTTTDDDGGFTISGVANGTYQISASAGFAGGSGLTGADALQVVRHFVGEITLSANAQAVADVNDDGSINSADALLIARRAADPTGVTFPGGDVFGETETITVTGDVTGIVLSVGAMGDVNQSFDPTPPATGKQAITALSAIDVDGETRAVQIGEAFELPITAASSASVGALTMEIDFPSELATFEGLVGLEGAITHVRGNTIRVVWFDAQGDSPLAVAKGDRLFSLRFQQTDAVVEGDAFETKFAAEVVNQDGDVLSANLNTDNVEFGALPETFALQGNYPNPFNPSTTITFDLPANADVHIEVFDVMGRKVMSLPAEAMTAGAAKQVRIDASELASGTYLYRILARGTSDTFTATGRMMLVK